MTWQTNDSRVVYENPWISVREDAVTGPAGDGIYGVVTLRNPAVFIVALDESDRVCLVTLDRYTVGRSIEVPAGGSDGEDPLKAAQRELREETGLQAEQWTPIGTMNALNGVTVAPEHVYLARGLTSVDVDAGHDNEGIEDEGIEDEGIEDEGIEEVTWVPFSAALAMVADGRISDGETVAALAYAGIHLGRFA